MGYLYILSSASSMMCYQRQNIYQLFVLNDKDHKIAKLQNSQINTAADMVLGNTDRLEKNVPLDVIYKTKKMLRQKFVAGYSGMKAII